MCFHLLSLPAFYRTSSHSITLSRRSRFPRGGLWAIDHKGRFFLVFSWHLYIFRCFYDTLANMDVIYLHLCICVFLWQFHLFFGLIWRILILIEFAFIFNFEWMMIKTWMKMNEWMYKGLIEWRKIGKKKKRYVGVQRDSNHVAIRPTWLKSHGVFSSIYIWVSNFGWEKSNFLSNNVVLFKYFSTWVCLVDIHALTFYSYIFFINLVSTDPAFIYIYIYIY